MNDTRARFEEIWPVPDSVFWSNAVGRYCAEHQRDYVISSAQKHNEYLDVFTRCQESSALVTTLIDDLVYDLGRAYNHLKRGTTYNTHSLERAQKFLESNK